MSGTRCVRTTTSRNGSTGGSRTPRITVVRDTRLGALNFKYFAGMETDPPTKMAEQYDSTFYLGPVSSITMSELSAALCSDAEYPKMRLARMALSPGGLAGADVAMFKKACAASEGSRSQRAPARVAH